MTESQPTRRVFVRNVAAVGGATALTTFLASCSAAGDNSTPETIESFTVPVSEVPVGGGVVLDEHNVVVTRPTEGEFAAFSATCTHKGCPLSSVEEGGAFCGCHSSYFDIATGEPVSGPAPTALPKVPVAVSGDTLTVG